MLSIHFRRKMFLVTCLLFSLFRLDAQSGTSTPPPASAPMNRSALLKAHEAKLIYPLFRGSVNTGVMPVPDATMVYEAKGATQLVFDLSQPVVEPAKGNLNEGLEEIMRIMNLHVAAGVPKEKLNAVIIFHGPATATFLNNENYRKRYQIDNPNLKLVKDLQNKGVKLVVCGQTIRLRSMELSELTTGVGMSYSARTALSDLQQKGYIVYDIEAE